jgi:hypothetical protein
MEAPEATIKLALLQRLWREGNVEAKGALNVLNMVFIE